MNEDEQDRLNREMNEEDGFDLRLSCVDIVDEEYRALKDDIFETFYCPDERKWSPADFIVFVMANTICRLGCRNCHNTQPKPFCWMTATKLSDRLNCIKRFEGNSNIKFSITFSFADFFLSPHRYEILDYFKDTGNILNIYSYFPQLLNLGEIEKMKKYYPDLILSWSLHGKTDKERARIFNSPHLISDIVPLIVGDGKYLNCVTIFSHLINNKNKGGWCQFLELFKECNVNFLNLIRYKEKKYLCRKVFTNLPSYHYSPTRYSLLKYLTGDVFEIVYLSDLYLEV